MITEKEFEDHRHMVECLTKIANVVRCPIEKLPANVDKMLIEIEELKVHRQKLLEQLDG